MDGSRSGDGAVEVPAPLRHRITEGLASVAPRSSSWSIFTVPNKLRNLNDDAYTPHVLSIGPFHHNRPNLAGMQTHKWRYTLSLLDRTEDATPTTDTCLKAILGFESEVRSCYAEVINLDSSQLAEILFLDGCFILELFLRYSKIEPNLNHGDLQNDPIFTTSWIISTLKRDMALLENQIPFFILEWLFAYTVRRSSSGLLAVSLTDIALHFFKSTISRPLIATPSAPPSPPTNFPARQEILIRMANRQSTKHLLHLIHISYSPPPSLNAAERRTRSIGGGAGGSAHVVFVPSVSDLCAAGLKIKKNEARSMFELELNGGVLEIPPLRIHDSTDALFRNLVAFEQCFHGCSQYVTSYALLMDRLIYTMNDVELLERTGIVENYLGSREDVTHLFYNICKQIGLQEFYFAGLCSQLNRSYNRLWNQWMVSLKRYYLTSPWTLLSVIAAFTIVLLTIVQTVYTVYGFYRIRDP
ncbi:UPF0481 protein At3g47200 [Linum perenne]